MFVPALPLNKHWAYNVSRHGDNTLQEESNMNIAYVRVSTVEQNEERQVQALTQRGIEKWFTEKVSGKDTQRPQLQAMLEFAREGDTIYIHDLSRLGRNTEDLLHITAQLQAKGINLVSNKESIDTSSATGKLIFTMIAAIAEFERTNLKERQHEGIAIAKQKGKYKGRKSIARPANWDEVFRQWKNREITATNAMQLTSLKRNTFYNFVNEENSK